MRKWWVIPFQQIVEFIKNFGSITKVAKPLNPGYLIVAPRIRIFGSRGDAEVSSFIMLIKSHLHNLKASLLLLQDHTKKMTSKNWNKLPWIRLSLPYDILMLVHEVQIVRTKASVKFPAKGQKRVSHAVLPVDKLAILKSTAPNAESQALNHCLRKHILLADLIISQIAVLINHKMIIDICHRNTDVTWTWQPSLNTKPIKVVSLQNWSEIRAVKYLLNQTPAQKRQNYAERE